MEKGFRVMTQNQLAYQKLLEEQRHNIASERVIPYQVESEKAKAFLASTEAKDVAEETRLKNFIKGVLPITGQLVTLASSLIRTVGSSRSSSKK